MTIHFNAALCEENDPFIQVVCQYKRVPVLQIKVCVGLLFNIVNIRIIIVMDLLLTDSNEQHDKI